MSIFTQPKIYLATLFSLAILQGRAQSATPEVIGSGGGSSTAVSGYQVDFSIGEMAIQTAGTDPMITEGFEQPAYTDAALPVLGLVLQAGNINNYAQLHFSTVQEFKNDHFIIERSDDGLRFDTIAVIKTKAPGGYSTSPLNYYYTDLTALKKVNYYRVRQVDQNGAFAYSDIVSLAGTGLQSGILKVFPNPVSSQLQVSLPVALWQGTANASIRIFNTTGRLILLKDVSGLPQTSINVSRLAAGTYILVYETGSTKQQTKFIKK